MEGVTGVLVGPKGAGGVAPLEADGLVAGEPRRGAPFAPRVQVPPMPIHAAAAAAPCAAAK